MLRTCERSRQARPVARYFAWLRARAGGRPGVLAWRRVAHRRRQDHRLPNVMFTLGGGTPQPPACNRTFGDIRRGRANWTTLSPSRLGNWKIELLYDELTAPGHETARSATCRSL